MRSARSQNRAQAWAYDLARQRDYALAMAGSREEGAEIEAAYEAERAAGPDFTRYHVGSSFEEPSEHRLNREDANRILVAFDVIRRGMFRHCRVPRRRPAAQGAPAQIEQAAPPSLRYREVLRILLRYGVRFGRVFPKLATIAREACVSVRTVQYAIDWLRVEEFSLQGPKTGASIFLIITLIGNTAMTGTELKIVTPGAAEVLGPEVDRAPTLHTNARTDEELLEVFLKTHRDGSAHTVRAYDRIGRRFIEALRAAGADLRRATLDDVQAALEVMRAKEDGTAVKPATINMHVAAVKSFLNFAHRVGFTRFNAAPLIKLKKAPRQIAQRLLGEIEVRLLIRAARPSRDRVMLEVAYFGGLRVSELVALTWTQVISRDSGEVQLEIVGKGDKVRQVLLPAEIAKRLLAIRGEAAGSSPVFVSGRREGKPLTERAIGYIVKAAARRAGINPAASVHWLRHAHASHAIDNGAPITLVSQTLGHADLKTTSVYAHSKPGESSGRYLRLR